MGELDTGEADSFVAEPTDVNFEKRKTLGEIKDLSDQIARYERDKPKEQAPAKWQDSDEYKSATIGRWGMASGFGLLILSLVGSVAMRTGAKGAMRSMTSAINGWNDGSNQKWKDARDDYDRNVEAIKDQNKKEQDAYKQAGEKAKDLKDKILAKRLYLLSIGQVNAADEISLERMDKHVVAQAKAVDKLKGGSRAVTMGQAEIERLGVEYAMTNKMPGNISARQQDQGNRDAVERSRTKALDYFEKHGEWPKVATSTAKGIEYKADTSAAKKIQERNTMIHAFAETAESNFQTIISESKRLEDMGKLPTFKSFAQLQQLWGNRIKGDPDVIPYLQAVYETALEYGKVVQGNTSNQALTDSARKEMMDLFSSANSHETVKRTAEMSKKLIDNRLSGFQKVNSGLLKKYKTTALEPAGEVPRGTEISTAAEAAEAGWVKVGKWKKDPSKEVWRDKKSGKPHVF